MAGQFGRKTGPVGPGPAAAAAVPDPAQDMAARRAAFIEAERRRRETERLEGLGSERREAEVQTARVYAPQKSVGVAYLLWFFLGMASVHRFYLGLTTSACVQVGLRIGGFALVLSSGFQNGEGIMLGFAMMAAGGLWLMLDLILIPHLVVEANDRLRPSRWSGPVAA